ncbi:hypothetical protein GGI00_001946, partial [Coemansia sp. RSA 2681]
MDYSPPKLAASLQAPPTYSGNNVQQQQQPQIVYVKSEETQQESPERLNLRG